MVNQVTKRQHYVWRAYLSAWTTDDSLFCLRDGKIFPGGLMRVAQQKYFYRLRELNSEEKKLVLALANRESNEIIRKSNLNWVKLFTRIFELKTIAERLGVTSPETLEAFREEEIELEEKLHSGVESDSKKYLDMLLNKDMSFYDSDSDWMDFCFFIILQYLRTPRMAKNITDKLGSFEGIDFRNIWPIYRIIYASNVSWNLFSKKPRFKIGLITSEGSNFITGDQPAVNTYAVGFNVEPEKFELFYPISPKLAVLISEDIVAKSVNCVDESTVQKYNNMIMECSHEQIYGAQESDLKMLSAPT